MDRSRLREEIFKLLFIADFHNGEEIDEQTTLFGGRLEEDGTKHKDIGSIENKAQAVFSKIPELDELIDSKVEGWKTSRMNKVDLTIIRLALYEIRFDEDVPVAVAINEAVELAKKYGTNDSPSFVNGVLSRLV